MNQERTAANISLSLVKADSLHDFLHGDGPRKGKMITSMIYFIHLPGGSYQVKMIHKDMDQKAFMDNLKNGFLYIREEDAKQLVPSYTT